MTYSHVGVLRSYVFAKGYGFIYQVDAEGRINKFFLHRSKIKTGKPAVGAIVNFDVSPILEGEAPSAINCEIRDIPLRVSQVSGGVE